MSAGLPVVAYDCIAGPSDMIDDGNTGFLIPLFDKDSFVRKLRYLMENPIAREKMGEKARSRITRFSCNVICEHFYSAISKQSNKS